MAGHSEATWFNCLISRPGRFTESQNIQNLSRGAELREARVLQECRDREGEHIHLSEGGLCTGCDLNMSCQSTGSRAGEGRRGQV